MDFQDLGKTCNESTCRQRDFLPFQCDQCQKTFCLDHRSHNDHQCEQQGKFQKKVVLCPLCKTAVPFTGNSHSEDEILEIHFVTQCNPADAPMNEKITQFCQFDDIKKCKNKLNQINTFTCKFCNRLLCLTHRFQNKHNCTRLKTNNQKVNHINSRQQQTNQNNSSSSQSLGNLFQNVLNRQKPQNSNVQFKELNRPICHICGKSFDDFELLVSHAEFAHQKQKEKQQQQEQQEKCEMCGKLFKNLDELIIHAENSHFNNEQAQKI